MSAVRGLRNNNPLNIRFSATNPWQGQVGQDSGGYAQFDTMENGVRAAAKDIRNKQAAGIKTIHQLISKWAPAKGTYKDAAGKIRTETNPTQAYINAVSRAVNVKPDAPLDWVNNDLLLSRIIHAMIKHENGINPVSNETVMTGIRRAKV